MMKTIIKYIQVGIFTAVMGIGMSLSLTGCTSDLLGDDFPVDHSAIIRGDEVIVTATVGAARTDNVTTSRALSDEVDLASKNVYVLEFTDMGNPQINTVSRLYTPELAEEQPTDGTVKYKLTLTKTADPRIIHFVVSDSEFDITAGLTEAEVGTKMSTTDGKAAYWRRLEFPEGYAHPTDETDTDGEIKWEPNDDLAQQLSGIKLVRNFAKVTVGVSTSVTNFTLKGFTIINSPQGGTVAPYSASTSTFPEFLDTEGSPLPYGDVAATYSGISAPGLTLGNQLSTKPAITDNTPQDNGEGYLNLPPTYFYERPYSNLNHTYLIVKGIFTDNTNVSTEGYYKLDIGAAVNAEDAPNKGVFQYFGLLRNYNYYLRINGVNAAGYSSLAEAAEGTVFNNISFDLETDDLKNMSDGKDLIRVNFTTAVITSADSTLVFRYAYKQGIDQTDNGKYNNQLANLIIENDGPVIEEYKVLADEKIDGIDWKTVSIKCKSPGAVTATQDIIVVNPETGLGRRVSLVLHNKWNYENMREFAGTWENWPETYNPLNINGLTFNYLNSTFENKIGGSEGSQFTLFFDIEDGIPEQLFPLVFTLESNRHAFENAPLGTIVVSSGPSYYDRGETRILYEKTVTWLEYNSALSLTEKNNQGTILESSSDQPIHRIRCRLRTIDNLTTPVNVKFVVRNENFNDKEYNEIMRSAEYNNLENDDPSNKNIYGDQ